MPDSEQTPCRQEPAGSTPLDFKTVPPEAEEQPLLETNMSEEEEIKQVLGLEEEVWVWTVEGPMCDGLWRLWCL